MGVFLRKSLKMGPVRFNFSKSGLGVSTGVKGLRVGVNANGKNYISGGRSGIYFKQNLSKTVHSSNLMSSNIKSSLGNEHQLESSDKYSQISNFSFADIGNFQLERRKFKYRLLLLLSIGILIYGISITNVYLLIIAVLLFFYNLISDSNRKNKANKIISKLENIISERKIDLFKEELSVIDKKSKRDKKLFAYIFSTLYVKIISDVVSDMNLDNEEKIILELIQNYLPKELITDINDLYLNNILIGYTQDNYLDSNEEKFVNDYINVFKVTPEAEKQYRQIMDYYLKAREIEAKPLIPIEPSIEKIKENNKCYHETPFKKLKNKTVKTFTTSGVRNKIMQFTSEKEGQLFITENTIQMIADGHSTVKIENIINLDLCTEENGVIEILLANKTQPIFLSTPNILVTFTILKKLLNRNA